MFFLHRRLERVIPDYADLVTIRGPAMVSKLLLYLLSSFPAQLLPAAEVGTPLAASLA